jgi:hypothetical protein
LDEISTRILDLVSQSIGSTDADLHCRYANRAYAALLGRAPESMVGTHIKELWGAKLYEEALPFINRVLAGEAVSFSKRVRLPNGVRLHGRIDMLPDPDGGYSFVMQALDEAERHAKDRDRLVHELDHRVNNTLQVLQSVLALEAQSADEPISLVLEAIKARVDALALSYEFLRSDQPARGWSAALVLERVAASIGPGDSASWESSPGLTIPIASTETFVFIAMELSRWASMCGDRVKLEAQLVPEGIELSAESEQGIDLTTRAGAAGISLVESFAERCGAGPFRGGSRLSIIFPLDATCDGEA